MTKPAHPSAFGGKALEFAMRDALGALEELANMSGYDAAPAVFEILSIEPANPRQPAESSRRTPLKLRLVSNTDCRETAACG